MMEGECLENGHSPYRSFTPEQFPLIDIQAEDIAHFYDRIIVVEGGEEKRKNVEEKVKATKVKNERPENSSFFL